MKVKVRWLLICLLGWASLGAQPTEAPKDWFHLDLVKDGFPGVSSKKMYEELLKTTKGEPVIVAVIDGGVDSKHEDLQEVMWVNEDEIPGNGIDDDKNGYVDDVHGWNFIGGKNGKNVQYDNLEVTRLYRQLKKRFENADPAKLSGQDKEDYEKYLDYKKQVEEKRESLGPDVAIYSSLIETMEALRKSIKKDKITLRDVQGFRSSNALVSRGAMVIASLMSEGNSFEELEKGLKSDFEKLNAEYNSYYNIDFDSRSIVGDNPNNLTERYYGNNDVKGPDADHGTHVAGIIGARRGNGKGMDGVANNVRIMAVRVVPDGDERDKDVANAIIYAVDNGAKVINMSFGKGDSPDKAVVDQAVRYALKKDVLLIHAAGNDGKENTNFNNFPNDRFSKKSLFGPKYADNWIEVGAVDWQGGENLAASFSNYSGENVDVFAPGVEIYSTFPDDHYESIQGTSMAAPVVAGVAAVLRSYFPDLTAVQVKNILMSSVTPQSQRVYQPGMEEQVAFSKLSLSGGIVNAYQAVKMAAETKGKKKNARRYFGPYSSGKAAGTEVVVP